MPTTFCAISSLTLPTAVSTPLPPYRRLSPSRSSIASYAPVDAPEGTAARPVAPFVEQDIDFDGRVPARIKNLPGPNAGDDRRHASLLPNPGHIPA